MIALAVALAVIAACCFAVSVAMQHGAVQATGPKLRVVKSPRWLIGTGIAVLGTVLHVVALSMAPLVIVQPIGVLSLVLTVLIAGRFNALAVVAVCVGTVGFVAIAASASASTEVDAGSAQLFVLGALVFGAVALGVRGRARCLLLATAAAVLFGLGSALIRAVTQDFTVGIAVESAVLILIGGWLVHQAYAAGPPAVVIASTTVVDPFTGVAVGLWLYGESAPITAGQAIALGAFALLSIAGVIALAQDPVTEERPSMPSSDGLRVLIGADTFPPDINGAANFAGRLAHGLAARGHDVHVASPASAVPIEDTEITMHPVTSTRTPFHPTFRICLPWKASREAEALIQRIQPDVVHVQSHFPVGRAVLKAAKRAGIPVVATNHFMPENLLGHVPVPRPMRGAAVRWAWRDLAKVFGNAQLVTAPTPRAVELLTANGLPGGRAISCGIDLAHYPARETHGELVLFVGRLDEEKNVDELIRAVATLPGVRAEIVGNGSCSDKLKALAEDLAVSDRVVFRGFVSDDELVDAYQRADLFCMPGTAELQSLATMEAMAAGLPVVVADAMALPHLVEPGVNGFRYPPGNVVILAAAIAEVFRNPATAGAMGRASREMITAHDIDGTLDAFEDVYLACLGRERAVRDLQGGLTQVA